MDAGSFIRLRQSEGENGRMPLMAAIDYIIPEAVATGRISSKRGSFLRGMSSRGSVPLQEGIICDIWGSLSKAAKMFAFENERGAQEPVGF